MATNFETRLRSLYSANVKGLPVEVDFERARFEAGLGLGEALLAAVAFWTGSIMKTLKQESLLSDSDDASREKAIKLQSYRETYDILVQGGYIDPLVKGREEYVNEMSAKE